MYKTIQKNDTSPHTQNYKNRTYIIESNRLFSIFVPKQLPWLLIILGFRSIPLKPTYP